jgi:hypothetical protein
VRPHVTAAEGGPYQGQSRDGELGGGRWRRVKLFGVVDIGAEGVGPGHGDDGEDYPVEGLGDIVGGGAGEGAFGRERVGDDDEPENFVENFQQDHRQHFHRADNSESGERGERGPKAPGDGTGGIPWALVGEDVRPGVFAEYEEHQDVEEAQEIDIDSGDAVVVRVFLENIFWAEGHGEVPCGDAGWCDTRERVS